MRSATAARLRRLSPSLKAAFGSARVKPAECESDSRSRCTRTQAGIKSRNRSGLVSVGSFHRSREEIVV